VSVASKGLLIVILLAVLCLILSQFVQWIHTIGILHATLLCL